MGWAERRAALLFGLVAGGWLVALPAVAVTPEEASELYGKRYLALWDAADGEALFQHCSEWAKSPAADASSLCRKSKPEFVAAVKAEAARCGPPVAVREAKAGDAKYERTAVHRDCPASVQFVRIAFTSRGGDQIQSIDRNEFAAGTPGAGPGPGADLGPALAGGGALLFVLVICAIAYVAIKSKARSQGRAWAEAARRLGLGLEPWDPRTLSDFDRMRMRAGGRVEAPAGPVASQAMRGIVRGTPINVAIQRHRGREPLTQAPMDSYSTTCRAFFRAPLGIAFTVGEQSFIGQVVSSVLGTQVLTTGHPVFDRVFRLTSTNPQRAVGIALRVGDDLVRVGASFHVSVIDTCVAIELGCVETDAAKLGATLEAAVFLAQRIDAAASIA